MHTQTHTLKRIYLHNLQKECVYIRNNNIFPIQKIRDKIQDKELGLHAVKLKKNRSLMVGGGGG